MNKSTTMRIGLDDECAAKPGVAAASAAPSAAPMALSASASTPSALATPSAAPSRLGGRRSQLLCVALLLGAARWRQEGVGILLVCQIGVDEVDQLVGVVARVSDDMLGTSVGLSCPRGSRCSLRAVICRSAD